MSGMQDKFDADLRTTFEVAKEVRDKIEHIKAMSREAPEATAIRFAETIPAMMAECRSEAAAKWHIDITNLSELGDADLDPRNLLEVTALLDRVNVYHALGEFLRRIKEHTDDPALSARELAEKVCRIGIEALEVFESSKLHMLQQIRLYAESYSSEEAAQMARDVEAQHLAGHLATRISLRTNRPLAKALDDIRKYDEPASRERFSALLRELYVEAPQIWNERHNTDLRLHATRSAVAKKIAQRSSSQPAAEAEEIEQATFAERAAVLKRGRDAGLPPREYELLKLLVEEPKISSRKAGERLGLSPGTVRALKARINKTLGVA
jgi:DNA-binding CsgD family transcriptional regulator